MTADPRTAPPRTDLPFLRHRSRSRGQIAVSDFFAGRTAHPHHPPHRQPESPVTSSSLDLSDPPAPAASAAPRAPTVPRPNAVGPGERLPAVARVRAHEQRVLSVRQPTVTLTRLQSGIGALAVEVVTSVARLRVGCAYQLVSGATSTVQLAGGSRFGPPGTRRPLIIAQREQHETLTFDLRQVRELERAAVYVFSDDGAELDWTGTLVATTFGGGRVELPLDTLYRSAVAVPLSIVNVGGELWLRAEMETVAGSIRDACRAYGFDRITWKDDRTPAD